MKYIPLNIKTNYSLLKSLIQIKDLILFALKNNIKSLGITDENMFSCIEFYDECIKNNIKPIIGSEITFNNITFLLYAKSNKGYINLCNIVSEKNIGELTIDYLKSKSEDIICVSSLYDYENLSKIFKETYIKYKNKKQRTESMLVTKNIVYMNEILCINIEEVKYLKYPFMIKDGKTIDDEIDYVFEENYFVENNDNFDIETTIKFSELIDFKIEKSKFSLPVYSTNSKSLLRALCRKGLEKRFDGSVTEEYKKRLLYELSVIEKMGFVDYFLIVYDFILYAKKNKIMVGPGRGSAAGSLVSYCLGITEIDPIKYGLIFERFLNPERITMPDIDTDFDDVLRDSVIDYVKDKYGNEFVCNIITFGTLLPKQVFRDVGRILNLPQIMIDKLCKTVNDEETYEKLLSNKAFIDLVKSDKDYVELLDISSHLIGLKRHPSIHAAGIVMNKDPLRDKVPLYKSGENILTGYNMYHLEELGILKMDFLGIRNLNTINKVVNDIKELTGEKIDVNKIPLDDAKTIELFNKVNTIGIFQFESSGMKSFLSTLKIKNFNDIVDAIALYRPGPREMIPSFIKRRERKEKVEYIFPELENILKPTNGIIVYQEQLLEILRIVGGYSYAEADNIRRAMSKKIESVIVSEKEKFIDGAIKNGFDKYKATNLYNLILKFANYGFNKSHSVSYSIVAYQMAYLKAHFPHIFMKHLLDMSINSDTKTKEYIDESKLLNIEFLNVNINYSQSTYLVKDNKLMLPFSLIKNIGIESTKEILSERAKKPFDSFYDFVIRLYGKSINKKVIVSLVEIGAFDDFKINKKSVVKSIDNIINYATLCNELDQELVLLPELEKVFEYSDSELMDKELEILGFYFSNHPVTKYKRDNMVLIKDINKYFDKIIKSIALVDSIKEIITKKNEKMAFFTVSDEYGKLDLVLFPRVYLNYINIKKGDIITFTGRVERRNDSFQVNVNSLEKRIIIKEEEE